MRSASSARANPGLDGPCGLRPGQADPASGQRERVISVAPESEFLGARPPKPIHHAKLNRVWYEVEELRKGRARGVRSAKRAFQKPLAYVDGGQPAMIRGDKVFTRGSGLPNDERSIWLNAGGPENARDHRRALIAAELQRVGQRVKLDDRLRVELHILEEIDRGRELPRPCDVASAIVREDTLAGLYERGSAEQKSARYSYRVIAALLMGLAVK